MQTIHNLSHSHFIQSNLILSDKVAILFLRMSPAASVACHSRTAMEVDLLYVTTFVTIIGLLYYLLTKNNGYFHDKPIPSMAVYPLLGSSAPLMLKRVTFPNFVKLIYDKYPSAR